MSRTSASFNLLNGTNILQRINNKIQGARNVKKPKYESDGLYKPLNVERREIRLLHVEPSLKLKEQPQCFLETVSLNDNPQFEALSYVWGDPSSTRPIRLENRQWYAAINLEAGLRYLRRPFEDIVIWVDALCIDQSSVNERNSQVLLMKTIYSNATQVKVWLGEPTSRSDDALAILEHMGRNIPFRDIRLHGKNLNYKHAKYLNELVNRPWWNRVWVQQEYSLAKDVTLHCGLRSIEFSGILRNEDIDRLCNGWDMRLYITMQTLGHSALLHRQHNCTGANDLTFTGILAQGCYKDCSDPRDSIYGFLGLAKEDVVHAITPDYGIPLEDVLRCTAVTHITCTRSLSFFNFTTLKSKDTRLVPTWVPEWPRLGPFQRERYESAQNQKRTVWDHRVNRFESILDFKACATRSLSFDLINETTVMLNGKCTGEVTDAHPDALRCESKTSPFIHPDVIKLIESWQKFFDQFADHAAFPSSTEGRESPLWRILTGDRHLDRRGRWRNCEKTDYEAYQAFQRHLVAGGALIEGESNCWVSITVASADRCLFATDRGHIGFGPLGMRKGDHVYILSGGEVPYILRPVSGLRPRTFELVGYCYLHGIMYGEAAGPDEDFHDVYLE